MYVIQTTQNTSPYIGCPNDKLTYDTEYGKFNTVLLSKLHVCIQMGGDHTEKIVMELKFCIFTIAMYGNIM